MKPSWLKFLGVVTLLSTCFVQTGCHQAYRQSIGKDNTQNFGRIYLTDFNTAWQAVLDSLKSSPIEVSNREAGLIQTKWVDNTAQKNFVDAFAAAESYQLARYRLQVTVAKGFYNGQPSVKVNVMKEQQVQRDALEGWRYHETDSLDENTLLYRIGRIIFIQMKIAKLEEQRIKKALDTSGMPGESP